jgi:hypothetical protein
MSHLSATLTPTASELSRDQLLRVAIARGCRHYATLLAAGESGSDEPTLSHETLGAALLRGPADADTFQAIRCGAMVLSDLGNSAEGMVRESRRLGVEHRLAHIARLGLSADQHVEFWQRLVKLLPSRSSADEEGFLPGVSRFTSESRLIGPRRASARVWLRTHWQ